MNGSPQGLPHDANRSVTVAEPTQASRPVVIALVSLAELVQLHCDQIADRAADRIMQEVPAYAQNADPNLRKQVSVHCRAILQTYLDTLPHGTDPQPGAFTTTADTASYRVSQGIGLPDYMRAFRIAQIVFWESTLELGTSVDAKSVLAAAAPLMRIFESASVAAAEAYLEVEQYRLADTDRLNRDLIEDLLAGREPTIGPRLFKLRNAGLVPDTRILVVTARTKRYRDDERAMRLIRTMLHQINASDTRGLFAIRHSEAICVLPANETDRHIIASLQRLHETLRAAGVDLAIGVSTVHHGLVDTPMAYREASVARDALGNRGGLLTLSSVPAFDYLILNDHGTAQRLLDPRVKAFVEQDIASGRVYLDTLDAYVACDMNAKQVGERLHLHANSVYYRLDRIAERTGKDIRRLPEVLDLLVASRLLASHKR